MLTHSQATQSKKSDCCSFLHPPTNTLGERGRERERQVSIYAWKPKVRCDAVCDWQAALAGQQTVRPTNLPAAIWPPDLPESGAEARLIRNNLDWTAWVFPPVLTHEHNATNVRLKQLLRLAFTKSSYMEFYQWFFFLRIVHARLSGDKLELRDKTMNLLHVNIYF